MNTPERTVPGETIVLVHGTFAAADSDAGAAWWQQGGNFRAALGAASGIETIEAFQWSGANSESERRAAGARLAERLRELEAAGCPYHVIGHSHGGSLIWHAIAAMVHKRDGLQQLRSFVTVGTPFLHFAPRPLTIPMLIAPLVIGFFLFSSIEQMLEYWRHGTRAIAEVSSDTPLRPLLMLIIWVAAIANAAISIVQTIWRHRRHGTNYGSDAIETPPSADRAGKRLLPALWLLTSGGALAALIWWTHDDVKGISLDSVRDSVRGARVFAIPVLWASLLLLLMFLIARIALILYARLEHWNEQRRLHAAVDCVGVRHLAIWSREDEAINGLVSTLHRASALAPRLGELRPTSSRFAILVAPARWIYNRVLAPASDEFVWNRVVRRLHGNHKFAASLISVSPGLLPSLGRTPPPLSRHAEASLSAVADEHAASLVVSARRALGMAATAYRSTEGVVPILANEIAFEGLVHSTYFAVESVRDLVLQCIRTGPDNAFAESVMAGDSPNLPPRPECLAGANRHRATAGARIPLIARGTALAVVANLSAVGAAALLWFTASALWSAWVYPHTDEAIVADVMTAPPLTQASNERDNSDATSRWIEALVRIGRTDLVESAIERLNSVHARTSGLAAAADQLRQIGEVTWADRLLGEAHFLAGASAHLAKEMSASGTDEKEHFEVVRALSHAGRSKEAADLLKLVTDDLQLNADSRARAIEQFAIGYAASGETGRAFDAARTIPDSLLRTWAYAALFDVLSARGAEPPEVLREHWFASAQLAGIHDWAAAYIARILAVEGDLAKAEQWIARVNWDQERSRALLVTALSYLPRDRARAEATADRVLRTLPTSASDRGLRVSAAGLFAVLGDKAKAEQLLSSPSELGGADNSEDRSAIVRLILGDAALAKNEVARLGHSVASRPWESELEAVVRTFGKIGPIGAATRSVEDWPDNAVKVQTLCRLSYALTDKPERKRVLSVATAATSGIGNGALLSTVLPELAWAWLSVDEPRKAIAACATCSASDRLKIAATLLERHHERSSGIPTRATILFTMPDSAN